MELNPFMLTTTSYFGFLLAALTNYNPNSIYWLERPEPVIHT
jgi:hypothetical protein